MDTIEHYQRAIKAVIQHYAQYKPAYGDIDTRILFDDEHNSYVLFQIGFENHKRVHDAIIHVEILDGKVWIQYDGIEEGIAEDLVEQGIPRDQIVLGFKPAYIRPYTDYAAA